jgi:hypothetical protein
MKKLLFFILLTNSVFLYAQPVIQPFTPVFGGSFNVYDINDSIPINFPLSGNQSWNFANAVTQLSFSISLLDPATTPYISDFPTANFAQSINSGTTPLAYFYGAITPDSLYGLGARSVVIPTANLTYINPNVSFRFPMTYQSTIYDISTDDQGDYENDQRTYIAYGDITTPFGTYNNVVLFRDQESDINGSWVSTKYVWSSVASLNTVFEIDSADGTGNAYDIPTVSSFGQSLLKDKYNYSLNSNIGFDNNRVLSITLTEPKQIQLELISAEGKQSETIINNKTMHGSHQIPVNTAGLSAGVYFLKLQINNEVLVEKIILL